MQTSNPSLNSREAALAVAESYENILAITIQLARLQNDSNLVKHLSEYLESIKKHHRRISMARMGNGDWRSFCKVELKLTEHTMEDCISMIKDLFI